MRMSKSQIGLEVIGATTCTLIASVSKGKDSYTPRISGGAVVDAEPMDGAGRIISFGTVDAAMKFVGSACPNQDITFLLPVVEGVKVFRKPVYATLAAHDLALKTRLTAERVTAVTSLAAAQRTVDGFVALGYDVSVIPAVKEKHTNAVSNVAGLDASIAFLTAKIATL